MAAAISTRRHVIAARTTEKVGSAKKLPWTRQSPGRASETRRESAVGSSARTADAKIGTEQGPTSKDLTRPASRARFHFPSVRQAAMTWPASRLGAAMKEKSS